MLALWKESYDKPRQCSKKQRYHFADKGPYNQAMVFPVVMYGCESWTIQKVECQEHILSNCAAGEDSRESFWTSRRSNQSIQKEIKPVIRKIKGRTDAEAPILWPPDAKNWLFGKDPHAGKDWKQKETGVAEDEMLRWHSDSMHVSLRTLQEIVKDRVAWHAVVCGVAKSQTWLSNSTTTN